MVRRKRVHRSRLFWPSRRGDDMLQFPGRTFLEAQGVKLVSRPPPEPDGVPQPRARALSPQAFSPSPQPEPSALSPQPSALSPSPVPSPKPDPHQVSSACSQSAHLAGDDFSTADACLLPFLWRIEQARCPQCFEEV